MPRYVIERTFPKGVQIPQTEVGARFCRGVVANNIREGVTWLHSYVTTDGGRTFCVYEAPSPEAIRSVAERTACRSTRSPRSRCSIRTSSATSG